jgi:hypothetical protein
MTEPFDRTEPQLPPLRLPRPPLDSPTPASEPTRNATATEDDAEQRELERVRRMQERGQRRQQYTQPKDTRHSRTTTFRIGAVVVLAVAVGIGLWLALRGNGSSSAPPSTATTVTNAPPVRISPKALKTLAGFGIPIYWAGTRPGTTYEMTKTADNRVYIRYLPSGVPIGTKTPYLTIGTYPLKHAFSVTAKLARESSSTTIPVGNNRVAFYGNSTPTSVYLAERGLDYQIEVFDPNATEGRKLVAAGKVHAVH